MYSINIVSTIYLGVGLTSKGAMYLQHQLRYDLLRSNPKHSKLSGTTMTESVHNHVHYILRRTSSQDNLPNPTRRIGSNPRRGDPTSPRLGPQDPEPGQPGPRHPLPRRLRHRTTRRPRTPRRLTRPQRPRHREKPRPVHERGRTLPLLLPAPGPAGRGNPAGIAGAVSGKPPAAVSSRPRSAGSWTSCPTSLLPKRLGTMRRAVRTYTGRSWPPPSDTPARGCIRKPSAPRGGFR